MSDKIKKFLTRLSPKELARVRAVLLLIADGSLESLDVKALKGKSGYIRIRVGRVRIICVQVGNAYEMVHITNRNEKTYKDM